MTTPRIQAATERRLATQASLRTLEKLQRAGKPFDHGALRRAADQAYEAMEDLREAKGLPRHFAKYVKP